MKKMNKKHEFVEHYFLKSLNQLISLANTYGNSAASEMENLGR